MPNTGQFARRYSVLDDFLDQDGDRQAWLTGLLAADGSIRRHSPTFHIVQSHDHGRALLETVAGMISYTGPVIEHGKTHTLMVTSRRLVSRLAYHGVVPNKSLTLRFPDTIPAEFHAAFIRGYVEGDGCTGVYRQPNGSGWPLISFVGTAEFMAGCIDAIPVKGGRMRRLMRARNLCEARFNGRHALALSRWLWASPDLPITRKQRVIDEFFATNTPSYLRREGKG